ncbi:hypothetical protein [Tellurirhabdus bombi]|uniref:hypothetical protein n=1 Tax=Tellurirhabdus bombi TaxID=2907205 RepID=UPI001F44A031|nr:hypothetical protein [Tellurirhabdus bombi]
MKFFVPATKDNKEAENVYSILQKKIRQANYKPTDARVYSITFEDNGQELTETVGKSSPIAHENVVAIFETEDIYLICTTNRGILRGLPIAAGKWAITRAELFDAE